MMATKTKNKKTTSVCFQVHGDFVTKHFRDRVVEGEWREALNGLVESLGGMDVAIAMEILKGNKMLVGINESVSYTHLTLPTKA